MARIVAPFWVSGWSSSIASRSNRRSVPIASDSACRGSAFNIASRSVAWRIAAAAVRRIAASRSRATSRRYSAVAAARSCRLRAPTPDPSVPPGPRSRQSRSNRAASAKAAGSRASVRGSLRKRGCASSSRRNWSSISGGNRSGSMEVSRPLSHEGWDKTSPTVPIHGGVPRAFLLPGMRHPGSSAPGRAEHASVHPVRWRARVPARLRQTGPL